MKHTTQHVVPQSGWCHLVDRRGEHAFAAPAGVEAVVAADADVVLAVPALAVDLCRSVASRHAHARPSLPTDGCGRGWGGG
jgi:hypothetical protein